MRVLVHKGLTAIFLTALTLFLCGGELPAAEMWLTGNSARPISMGRAYTAAQNDIGTLFYNPAGISEAVSFEMSSLSTKLGGDFSYSSFGCAIPLPRGVIGLGVMWKSSAGFYETTREASGRVASTRSFDYSGNTLFFTYADRFNDQWKYGSRLRYEGENAQGVSGGTGSKLAVDAGLVYDRSSDMSLGLSVSNLLSGHMLWSNGYADEPLQEIKMGVSYRPRKNMELLLDLINSPGSPFLIKAGMELRQNQMFSLRGGIEQVPAGDATSMNFTMGLGIEMSGFGFDYAYLSDSQVPGNTTQFFSVKLVIPALSKEKYVEADFSKWLKAWIDSAQSDLSKGNLADAYEKLVIAQRSSPANDRVTQLLKEVEEGPVSQPTKEAAAKQPLEKPKQAALTPSDMERIKDSLGNALKYFHFGEYKLAIEACNNALAVDPDNILAYKRLGSIYYFLGDMNNASSAWEKAYNLNKKDANLKKLIDTIKTQQTKGKR